MPPAFTIKSRIVWSYDSSGVQAKNYFGSMYEPILMMVKDQKNYTFNRDDILVEAKTGAKRALIDYRKNPPQPYNQKKVPGNVWEFPRVRYLMDEYENHPTQKPKALLERIILASSNPMTRYSIRSPAASPPELPPWNWVASLSGLRSILNT